MDNTTKQYRLQQWALAIRDQQQSGLSVDAWCKEHGVGRDAYFYRKRVVKKALLSSQDGQALLPGEPVFAEVSLGNHDAGMSGNSAQACIHTAAADILLNGNASAALIANILKALQQC